MINYVRSNGENINLAIGQTHLGIFKVTEALVERGRWGNSAILKLERDIPGQQWPEKLQLVGRWRTEDDGIYKVCRMAEEQSRKGAVSVNIYGEKVAKNAKKQDALASLLEYMKAAGPENFDPYKASNLLVSRWFEIPWLCYSQILEIIRDGESVYQFECPAGHKVVGGKLIADNLAEMAEVFEAYA